MYLAAQKVKRRKQRKHSDPPHTSGMMSVHYLQMLWLQQAKRFCAEIIPLKIPGLLMHRLNFA